MIKYIGYFDSNKINTRNISPAAISKMKYVFDSLEKINKQVKIISPAIYNKKHIKNKEDNERKTIYAPNVFNSNKKFLLKANVMFSRIWLFFYLLINIKKDDIIIVYHSLSLMNIVRPLKKIKQFSLILEINEIYCDVIGSSNRKRNRELKYFKLADKYLFSTSLLNDVINKDNKDYVINHGTYSIVEKGEYISSYDKIHVVFSGTLDPRKGVNLALSTSQYLDNKYHLHILGFGSEKEKENLLMAIKSLKTKCMVTFEGLLLGDKYNDFLHKCHIGLCTQQSNQKYNTTSFPSKVLSYLSNGLRVISIELDALKKSKVSNLLYYYKNDDPEEIAEVIKNIDFTKPYNSKKEIASLNNEFLEELKKLL